MQRISLFFHHSRKGSALLISLIILIIVTLMTTVFLERIWTFSQSSKGIEASNMAYYSALGLVEEQLIYTGVTKFQPWNIQGLVDSGRVLTGRVLTLSTGAITVPGHGEGTSSFDSDYNIVTIGDPIQLVIPDGIDWSQVNFDFRVPKIGTAGTGTNAAYDNSGFILWTIGYTGASLFASGETNIFQGIDINSPTSSRFSGFHGISNTGTYMTLNTFYTTEGYLGSNGANCGGYSCTLKLSLIRPVPLADGRTIPFLEYKITFPKSVPSQHMILNTKAYSYGFFRSSTIRIPQITTNTALDFAILQ